jgi:hypothetical protein
VLQSKRQRTKASVLAAAAVGMGVPLAAAGAFAVASAPPASASCNGQWFEYITSQANVDAYCQGGSSNIRAWVQCSGTRYNGPVVFSTGLSSRSTASCKAGDQNFQNGGLDYK